MGFWVLGLEYKLFLSILIALLDSLPFLGVGAGLFPMMIYFIFHQDYFKVIYLLILYLLIYLSRTFLENYLMKNKMKIPSFFIFISFFIHIHLFGFIGVFLSPLTLCVIHSIIDNYKRIK